MFGSAIEIVMPRTVSLILALSILCIGCGERVDPSRTAAAVAWLKDYYGHMADRSQRWVVTDVTANGEEIDIAVVLPDLDAQALTAMPMEQKFRLVSKTLCPSQLEPI
jgi:hypothetical protein